MPSLRQMVVSVDTEEEGLWGDTYRVSGNTTENLRGLEHFQAMCERLQFPPTYLIDAPVLENAEAIESMARWQRQGSCEVGTHCHPWCNPPLADREPTSEETYLCNLPIELQYEKLQWLTNRIAQATNVSPTSYRAGRYGFDESTAKVLGELGYRVDSSVLPMHEYRDGGGPDFCFANRFPETFPDSPGLIEIPVTAGFTSLGYAWRRACWIGARKQPWKRLRVAGIADRLGLARRVKLSPEGTRMKDLKRLVDASVADGLTTLVLMLHSTSLVEGFSPYASTAEKLEQLYVRLMGVLKHAAGEHGFVGVTLTQAAENLLPVATQKND